MSCHLTLMSCHGFNMVTYQAIWCFLVTMIYWQIKLSAHNFWGQSIMKTGTTIVDPYISWFDSRNKFHNDVSWWDDCHEQGSIVWFACLPLIGSWIISLLLASALKGHHGILSPPWPQLQKLADPFSENPEWKVDEEEKHGRRLEWDVISRAPFAPVSEAYLWTRGGQEGAVFNHAPPSNTSNYHRPPSSSMSCIWGWSFLVLSKSWLTNRA